MGKKTVEEHLEYLQKKVGELEDRADKYKGDIKKLQLDLRTAEDNIAELEEAVFEEDEEETESPPDDGDDGPPEEGADNFDDDDADDEIDDLDDDPDNGNPTES